MLKERWPHGEGDFRLLDRVVVINDLSRAAGGQTAIALDSAIAARKANIAVTFITGDEGDVSPLTSAGVEIVSLGGERLMSLSGRQAMMVGLYNQAASALVRDWIREHDTPSTVYHLHGWAQTLSPSVFAALQSVSDRLVISAHDFFLACPTGSFSLPRTGAVCDLKPLSARCVLTNCDRRNYGHKVWRMGRQIVANALRTKLAPSPMILVVHPAMRPFLMRGGIPAHSIMTLRNPATGFATPRRSTPIGDELLFVGRLDTTKGPHVALEAARKAGVKMRVIGTGPLEPRLRMDYPEMEFAGHVERAQIGPLAANARALIMPSLYPEPFGLAAVEALWSGLPVIVSDTALLADEIVACGAGMAFKVGDVDQLAEQMRLIMSNEKLAVEMGKNAVTNTKELAMNPVEWSNTLIDIYQSLIENNISF